VVPELVVFDHHVMSHSRLVGAGTCQLCVLIRSTQTVHLAINMFVRVTLTQHVTHCCRPLGASISQLFASCADVHKRAPSKAFGDHCVRVHMRVCVQVLLQDMGTFFQGLAAYPPGTEAPLPALLPPAHPSLNPQQLAKHSSPRQPNLLLRVNITYFAP
jgi:hypothetical protein